MLLQVVAGFGKLLQLQCSNAVRQYSSNWLKRAPLSRFGTPESELEWDGFSFWQAIDSDRLPKLTITNELHCCSRFISDTSTHWKIHTQYVILADTYRPIHWKILTGRYLLEDTLADTRPRCREQSSKERPIVFMNWKIKYSLIDRTASRVCGRERRSNG